MVEQLRETAHDREAEADALGAIALRIAELVELLEHMLLLVGGNAATRIPDLDAELITTAAAADDDAAAIRVRDCIRNDVAQDALQQQRVARHGQRALVQHQLQAPGLRLHFVVAANPFEQRLHGDRHAC